MPPAGLLITDLGGGLNEGIAPTDIADREFESIINFLAFGRKIIRRLGVDKLSTSAAFSEDITGIFAIKLSTGTWTVVVAGTSAMGRLAAAAFTALTNDDAVAIGAGTLPWVFVQYKDIGYAVRRNCTGMRRISGGGTNFDVAGIAAPSTNAAIADGAAGVIEAGNVYVYYTFYNTNTGAESNPSPVSAVLAHGANLQINWTSVDVSTDPQVNARRLYRTTPGAAATAPALFVGQINDNTTTTFTDNVATTALGDPAKITAHGIPPVLGEIMDIHLERLFMSDGTDIFFSEFGLPESFDPLNVISINPDDGHEVRAIRSYGDRLVAGKTNKVYGITGSGIEDFDVGVVTEDYGCYSHHSMRSSGGTLFWYAGQTFCRSAGSGALSIADVKLKARLARIPDARKQYVVAAVAPEKDLYIVSVPLDGSTENTELWAYNYRNDAWLPQQLSGGHAAAAMADMWDVNYGRLLYMSTYDSHLYQLFSGNVDDTNAGAAITATAKTKRFSGTGGPGLLRAVRRLFLQADAVPNDPNITLEWYRDGETAPVKTRTVSLAQLTAALKRRSRWFNLSSSGTPGATFSLGISYAGTDPIEIEQLGAEYIERSRRGKIR